MPGVRKWLTTMAGISLISLLAASQGVASAGSATLSQVGAYHGVACPTSKVCVAVGSDFSLSGKSAVINTATGKVHVWSGVVNMNEMDAVACRGPSTCLALSQAGNNDIATVSASTGAMKVTDMPKPPIQLDGIACASATTCYAVGLDATKAVVIHLSGAGKQLGLVKGSGANISAIACPSSTLCLIVDNFQSGGQKIQLLNNGHLGTSRALPAKTSFQQLACFQGKVCYALGGSTADLAPVNELFPLNPKTGAIGRAVKITGSFNGMNLACASAIRCLIVGGNGSQTQPLPELVTVSRGKPGKPVKLGTAKDQLFDVACASATVCYAVGTVQGLSGFVIKA